MHHAVVAVRACALRLVHVAHARSGTSAAVGLLFNLTRFEKTSEKNLLTGTSICNFLGRSRCTKPRLQAVLHRLRTGCVLNCWGSACGYMWGPVFRCKHPTKSFGLQTSWFFPHQRVPLCGLAKARAPTAQFPHLWSFSNFSCS